MRYMLTSRKLPIYKTFTVTTYKDSYVMKSTNASTFYAMQTLQNPFCSASSFNIHYHTQELMHIYHKYRKMFISILLINLSCITKHSIITSV